MDKQLIAERFAKARKTYSKEARAQQMIAERMMNKIISCHSHHTNLPCPKKMIEFGCGTGIYSRLLVESLCPEFLMLNDLCPEMEDCLQDLLTGERGVCFMPGDAECIDFPKDTDMITSCSTLQWFCNPEAFFARCHDILSDTGILAFSTFGPDNLREIRQLTGNGLHYPAFAQICAMLSPRFNLLYAQEEVVPLSFPTPLHVLRHLKETGVTGTEKRIWTRNRLDNFCQSYIQDFRTEKGEVTLTYHPIYIIAQKK